MSRESIRANEDVLRRVQGEFLEMPGLRLTEAQARRLWNLDAASCSALLTALVESQFLFRTRDGAFMRIEHGRPARASAIVADWMGKASVMPARASAATSGSGRPRSAKAAVSAAMRAPAVAPFPAFARARRQRRR